MINYILLHKEIQQPGYYSPIYIFSNRVRLSVSGMRVFAPRVMNSLSVLPPIIKFCFSFVAISARLWWQQQAWCRGGCYLLLLLFHLLHPPHFFEMSPWHSAFWQPVLRPPIFSTSSSTFRQQPPRRRRRQQLFLRVIWIRIIIPRWKNCTTIV